MSATRQATRPLPRGRHGLSRDEVGASQRARLLDGMAQAVAEKGYARTVVSDVHTRAGVSKKTFYEHFSSKEECFLAAYDASVDELLSAIDAAIAAAGAGGDLTARAMAGIDAYLGELAARPATARTFLIEVHSAGDVALAARAKVHERFADQLQAVHGAFREQWPELPADVPRHRFRAAVGATNELVTDTLLRKGAAALPAIRDQVLDVQVALVLGPEAAGPVASP